MTVIGNPRSFHKKFKFVVEIDDVGHAGFQKASELSVEVANVQYFEGGSLIPNKSPGRLTFSDVTLERGATQDRDLFDWFQDVAITSSGLGLTDVNYKRNLDIVQQDRDGTTLRRWSLSRAWPTKFVAGEWDNDAVWAWLFGTVAMTAVAQDPRFREAVVWQNRHAAATGLASFLRRPAGSGRGTSRDRGHVQMLTSYLQRYCIKNDTIGFFGPVGWAELGAGEGRISVRPGPEMIASRDVFLEGWAIDALADRLAEDEAMRPWLAPLRSPFIRREGTGYVLPNGQRIELGPLGSALVAACDGTRSARVLMRELGPVPPDKEPILWGMLAQLHQNGLIRWGFQIPLSPDPERILRELLLQIEDEPLRERSVAALDQVVSGRDAVVRAAGQKRRIGEERDEVRRVAHADAVEQIASRRVLGDARLELVEEDGLPPLGLMTYLRLRRRD